ncbi:hypothetical protein ACHAXS_009861 [Conticribra weissflogii]
MELFSDLSASSCSSCWVSYWHSWKIALNDLNNASLHTLSQEHITLPLQCPWIVLHLKSLDCGTDPDSIQNSKHHQFHLPKMINALIRTCIKVGFLALNNFLLVYMVGLVCVVTSCLTIDLAVNGKAEERDLTKD